ncbi:putative autophagy protein 5 [Apostichopus japonicus]|uniref:Autophagy protein 5 n=1 Tax=Stichopus japonicus TaxID=307972 RepID=A0A2G8JYD6_STIJA|nr:putative autophagy protein 5 [Apostichopus japonicus]
MAADDREILREVWQGKLPICFSLADDEEKSSSIREPCFLLVSRLTYITLIAEKILKHFKKGEELPEGEELWFEFNNQPLKWHYPVGVLFDLLTHNTPLPWNVKIHFKNFPEDELLHCESKEVVEAHFMSSIKEADILKHRGQVINNMQKRDHKQLWQGLQNDKFDQFWTINRRLMERTNEEPFRSIPLRIYQRDKMYIQRLAKPVTSTGEPLNLGHVLKRLLPDLFNNSENLNNRALIHGVEVPTETPVQWLSEHLSHPDNFLHIVVLPREAAEP